MGILLTIPANAQTAHKASKSAKASVPTLPAPAPVLEPKAIEILKAACAKLAAAHSMSFTAVISYENPSRLGPPLIYTVRDDVTLERPDKLKVITPGDGPVNEFYYDGKTMSAYAPAENLVAVASAPPTIDAMLEAAHRDAAIYYPFTDVIVADPYEGIADGMTTAFYIGQSHVMGGVTTDMVAVNNNWVFEQLWIGADDKLPRMARAVFHADPVGLRHQIEFSNWQIDQAVAPGAFTSPGLASAKRISFSRPDPQLPPGIKPPKRTASSKAN
ncbi:DUF2092 domain-containing protein [Candidatus Binatus sp.]|uniref:DUF2092 domain-containing protein n=1 Tax=Candidatus Binatus sp. TaxID=2811406 RepID=UPI003BB028B5